MAINKTADQQLDILVAGGGIVGLSFACAMAQRQINIGVVEMNAPKLEHLSPDYDLRVYAISPASQRFLESIGIWKKIISLRACTYKRMEVWDAQSQGKIEFDSRDLDAGNLGHIVEHQVLSQALWERCRALENIQIFSPDKIRHIDFQNKFATAELDSGKILAVKLIVGAEGSNSKVRELAGIVLKKTDYQQQAIVACVATEIFHGNTAWQAFLSGGPLAFLPLADGRSSIVWSLPEDAAAVLMALPDDAFNRELSAAFGPRLGSIISIGAKRSFTISAAIADRFIAPRTALIGDAAHVVHPLAGQGMNLGLADAQSLYEALADEKTDFGNHARLRRYERARRPAAQGMLSITDGFHRAFTQSHPLLRPLCGSGLALANRLTPIKRELMRYAMG